MHMFLFVIYLLLYSIVISVLGFDSALTLWILTHNLIIWTLSFLTNFLVRMADHEIWHLFGCEEPSSGSEV